MRGKAEIREGAAPIEASRGRGRSQVVHDAAPLDADPSGAVVDVEQAPAHGGDAGHAPDERAFDPGVEVEEGE